MAAKTTRPALLDAALVALLLGLCLGTFATELTTGLALAAALLWGRRSELAPWWPPLLLLAAALAVAAAPGPLADWREVVGRVWPFAPLLAVPALLAEHRPDTRARLADIGLWAAGLLGLAGAVQAALTQAAATGPFSHHLTLGYALVPPLAVAAARRRWLPLLGCGIGVLASGASGPLLAAAVALAAATRIPPGLSLAAGVGAALAVMRGLQQGAAPDGDLAQRVLLWRTGARVAEAAPWGTGPTGFREAASVAQHALQPGFHFPLHAHDSVLQLAAVAGMGAWIALAVLVATLWRRTDRAGRAVLAGLAVGALTQDVLGDLEVVRAAAVWLAWGAVAAAEPARHPAVPSRAALLAHTGLGHSTPSAAGGAVLGGTSSC